MEGGHVVDAAVHGEPHVVDGAVAAELGARDLARRARGDRGHLVRVRVKVRVRVRVRVRAA